MAVATSVSIVPTMRPTLVALDLDGTLLEDARSLPMGHRHAVRRLTDMGVRVAIVTGRPLLTATWVHETLALDTPIVAFNGGWVGHATGTILASAHLDQNAMRRILDAVREILPDHGATCGYPDARTWLMDRLTEQTADWPDRYGTCIGVDPQRFAAWTGPSLKVMVVGPPARIPFVARALRARFGSAFEVVISQEDRLEVMPRGITKAWGLAHLATHLGIARADVWAVGDADNDLEMIRWAGHGCAMGQAELHLHRAARHILPGIQARGLCALPPLIASSWTTT